MQPVWRIRNEFAYSLKLQLEIVGDLVILPAGQSIEIHFADKQVKNLIEMDLVQDSIVLYAVVSQIFILARDGERTKVWPRAVNR